MKKTVFSIQKMDCPSEENLIRMKLQECKQIHKLDFDLQERKLAIFHTKDVNEVQNLLSSLSLRETLISSKDVDETIDADIQEESSQRKLLLIVLAINFLFFIIEVWTGIISHSMGLIADSLDMLADSFVYLISLLAVGATVQRKKSIAKIAGIFQIILAMIGFVEVLRRFFGFEQMPDFQTMIVVSIFALIANGLCLYLLQKSKSNDAHMKASMIFTSNDVIINLGVIVAAVLVYYLQSSIPDLIVGAIIFIVVLQGARRILKLSK